MSIAVSIVEDNSQVRSSLAKLIDGSPGYRCVNKHGSAEEALKEIPKLRPQVVLMDINLPGINGVECARQLKPQLPGTQIIMLTVYQNTEHIFNALAAGATGYMLKQTPPAELLAAIKDVNAGGSPMSSHIARKIVQSFQPTPAANAEAASLSPREAEVLNLLAKGFLYKEIAEQMGSATPPSTRTSGTSTKNCTSAPARKPWRSISVKKIHAANSPPPKSSPELAMVEIDSCHILPECPTP